MRKQTQNLLGIIIGFGFIISGLYRLYYLGFDADVTHIFGTIKISLYVFAYLQIGLGLMMLYKKMQHLAGWGMLTILTLVCPLFIADGDTLESGIVLKIIPNTINWFAIILHIAFMAIIYKVIWGRSY